MDSKSPQIISIFIATGLILALALGFYWGIAVEPKKHDFWDKVNTVGQVSGATVTFYDGEVVNLSSDISSRLFDDIRDGESFSPNHPSNLKQGVILFETDQGNISWEVSITRKQGMIFYANSNVTSGWNLGVRRSDMDIGVPQ